MCKRVYDFPPLHLNLTMFLLGAKAIETAETHKTKQNTQKYKTNHTYTEVNTQVQNITSLYQQQDHT